MFEMCNYKSGPYSVAKHWATKSVLHYRDPARGVWYTSSLEPASQFVQVPCRDTSPAVDAILLSAGTTPFSAIRSLRSVMRGPSEVRIRDWVLIAPVHGEPHSVGLVQEMYECKRPNMADTVIRLWVSDVKDIHLDEQGTVFALHGLPMAASVLMFECYHVDVVVRSEVGSREVFT